MKFLDMLRILMKTEQHNIEDKKEGLHQKLLIFLLIMIHLFLIILIQIRLLSFKQSVRESKVT